MRTSLALSASIWPLPSRAEQCSPSVAITRHRERSHRPMGNAVAKAKALTLKSARAWTPGSVKVHIGAELRLSEVSRVSRSSRAMKRSAARLSFALWSLVVAGLTPPCVFAQESSDEWHFAATVYGWLPDIGGHTKAVLGDGRAIHVDISTILDHLKLTGQGSFEIQKGHWGGFTDLVYLDVGDSKSQTRGFTIGGQALPASVQATADFDLKSVIWTFAGSYRSFASPGAKLDWFAGARLASFKQDLSWQFTGSFGPITPPPLTGSRRVSVDQWDAIVGLKGRFAFGADHKWVAPFYVDVGTGDSDLTWQAMLGLGYSFGWGDLGVAWRYLDYDLKSGGAIADMNFNGPALGIAFHW